MQPGSVVITSSKRSRKAPKEVELAKGSLRIDCVGPEELKSSITESAKKKSNGRSSNDTSMDAPRSRSVINVVAARKTGGKMPMRNSQITSSPDLSDISQDS